MTENVENLILTQLREMRGELSAMRSDIAAIKTDMRQVDHKVDGLTVMLALLPGMSIMPKNGLRNWKSPAG